MMYLRNFNKVRIKKYPKGYVVEVYIKRVFLKNYWTHVISVSGMESIPWYFKSYKMAESEVLKYFKWEISLSS